MQITTRNDGANIVVELNGGKVAAFDHIEGDLGHARMQAEAYARGLKDGLALAKSIPDEELPKLPDHHPMALKPPMSLYTWTSEAVSDGVRPGTLVAMARHVDDARDMLYTAAFAERRAPGHGLSSAQLEHDLEAEPRIVASGALVISP